MAKKVYLLSEIMRSSKGGFFIEGTDIAMDFPDKYPLPLETEVLENGVPIALRVLPNCGYIEKERQIKAGFPVHFRWRVKDQDKVTFLFRRLELDERRDKIYVEFIERSAWMEGNEMKKTSESTKTIFFPYDENVELDLALDEEKRISQAKNLVLDLLDSEIRNLYRLANPGVRSDGLILVKQMRKHLLDVAGVNPEFILNGVKSSRDKTVVLVGRAIDAGVVSMDFPGSIALYNDIEKEWQNLVNVSDSGGPEEKFDHLIDYLATEAGATDLAIIEAKTKEAESRKVEETNPTPQKSKSKK